MSVREMAAEVVTRVGVRHMRLAHRCGMLAASIRSGNVEQGCVAVIELGAIALRLDVVAAVIDRSSHGLDRAAGVILRAVPVLREIGRGAVGAWLERPERAAS